MFLSERFMNVLLDINDVFVLLHEYGPLITTNGQFEPQIKADTDQHNFATLPQSSGERNYNMKIEDKRII